MNYWYHGSVRGRGMRSAIRSLVAAGHRSELVVVLQSYSRWAWLLERTFRAGLKSLNIEYADVLLLGLHNAPPSSAIIERALRLRDKGLVRHLAVSAHRRAAFLEHAQLGHFDVFHVRYSAAHPGADVDVFPQLPSGGRPGIVAYTATRWGQLLDPARMPQGDAPLHASDCYRFVLTNPNFNVCMTGPRNAAELAEALIALDAGPLAADEEQHVRRVGEHVRAQRTVYQRLRSGRAAVLDSNS